MAYTFDNINKLIEQNNAQGGSNIFGGGQGGGDQQPQDSGQQGQAAGQKTTTEGGTFAQGSASSGSQQQQAQAPKTPQSSSAKAIVDKAAKSNLDTSAFTKGIQGNIGKAQDQLKSEADSFVQNQAGRARQGVDAETVRRAVVGGDAYESANEGVRSTGDFSKVEQVLRGPATQAEEFRSGASTKFQDLDQISSQGGLQDYLQRRGKPQYGQGMAALDAMLISRDKGYQQNLAQTRQQAEGLRKEQAELEGGKVREQAQAEISAREAAAKEAALAELAGIRGKIDQDASATAASYNRTLDARRAAAGQTAAAKEAEILNALRSEYGDLAPWIGQQDLNEREYYSVAENVNPMAAMGTQDAQRYNRIMSLLGQGGPVVQGNYLNYDNMDSFDRERFTRDALARAQAAKDAAARVSTGGTLGSGGGGTLPGQNAVTHVGSEVSRIGKDLGKSVKRLGR